MLKLQGIAVSPGVTIGEMAVLAAAPRSADTPVAVQGDLDAVVLAAIESLGPPGHRHDQVNSPVDAVQDSLGIVRKYSTSSSPLARVIARTSAISAPL